MECICFLNKILIFISIYNTKALLNFIKNAFLLNKYIYFIWYIKYNMYLCNIIITNKTYDYERANATTTSRIKKSRSND